MIDRQTALRPTLALFFLPEKPQLFPLPGASFIKRDLMATAVKQRTWRRISTSEVDECL
jgi:hypothetical protein